MIKFVSFLIFLLKEKSVKYIKNKQKMNRFPKQPGYEDMC